MTAIFDAELPAVWIDPVTVESVSSRLVLGNRSPAPGESGVPGSTSVEVTVFDTASVGPGVSLADTTITIDGMPAYVGGVFQAGFDGVGSLASTNSNRATITIDRTMVDFPSLTLVPIRVVTASSDGAATLDESYMFTVADTTNPVVLSAVATGQRTVVVTFNKSVRLVGDGDASDALTPANYTLTHVSVPSVTSDVTAVTQVTNSSVELLFELPLTQRATYALTVASVSDVLGNPVAPPLNSVQFAGFVLPVPAGRRFDLYRMIPLVNRRQDEEGTRDLGRFIRCVQEVVDLQLFDIDNWGATVLDPDVAPEPVVDAMLADLGNPFKFDLSLVEKRRLIRVLVSMYKQKGTSVGIINVVRFFLGFDVQVVPYASHGMLLGEAELGSDGTDGDFELGADGSRALYSFNIVVDRVLTERERSQLYSLVRYMKSAHTHFVELVEPVPPTILDHWELGFSEVGVTTDLH